MVGQVVYVVGDALQNTSWSGEFGFQEFDYFVVVFVAVVLDRSFGFCVHFPSQIT